MKKWAVPIVLMMIVLSLSGCHTMQGFGKDIQRGGEAIERGAQ